MSGPWRLGAIVAAGWAALLAVFVILSAAYGEATPVVLMFAASVVLALLIALAVLAWTKRHPGPRRWSPIVPAVSSAPLFAAAAALVGLGVVFTWALYPVAFWLAVLGTRRTLRERQALRRRP